MESNRKKAGNDDGEGGPVMMGDSRAAAVRPKWGALALAAVAGVALVGCGSGTPSANRTHRPNSSAERTRLTNSSTARTRLTKSINRPTGPTDSSAERTRLTNQISAQLRNAGAPSDLASCVTEESRGLPLASVREIVRAGSHPPAAAGRLVNHLFATCVAQGKGVAWLRGWITHSIRHSNPSELPTALATCLEQRMNAISPSELSSLLFPTSATQLGTAHMRARQLGVRLAEQCFEEPALRPVLLGLFLSPVERSLTAEHVSTAFRSCVLGKLRQIPSSEFVRLAADPATAKARGRQLGRDAVEACIASGVKP